AKAIGPPAHHTAANVLLVHDSGVRRKLPPHADRVLASQTARRPASGVRRRWPPAPCPPAPARGLATPAGLRGDRATDAAPVGRPGRRTRPPLAQLAALCATDARQRNGGSRLSPTALTALAAPKVVRLPRPRPKNHPFY